ncbi:MAG: hypothetical protein K2Y01_07785 [Rhabdochlamydiaceae bacterium]|nr:hypothetical protein [Rhabdochlamydiaceae bacterium]
MIRLGVAIGLISSLFAIGGIRFLKWASVVTLPCIFIYAGYTFFHSDYSFHSVSWGLSFPAVLMIVLSWLAGTLNLPTFFRHSISVAHSYLALTLLTLFFTLFQSIGVFMRFDAQSYGLLLQNEQIHSALELTLFSVFIVLTCLCNNLLNIYFASACYETFSPRFYGTKGHAIIGLLGTAAYAFIQISHSFQYILDLFNCYLLNLGIVLLIAFLIHAMMKYKSKPLEKWTNCVAWIVGCIAGTIAKWNNPEDSLEFLLVGASASTLFFLATIFLEETGGAIRTLFLQKARK